VTSLVLCPCAHSIEGHDLDGCKGHRLQRCSCTLTPGQALNSAIDAVRSTYVTQRLAAENVRREA
jgi:hypothetical protein